MKRWRDALLSLSSEAFLDLARTYLGTVRTPFSKQDLLERLAALLRRDDVAQRIAGLLDQDDAAMLTAVRLLDEPSPGRLMEFLLPEGEEGQDRARLLSRMVNLEERLLLYEYREPAGAPSRLAITPALSDLVDAYAHEPSLLFPDEEGAADSKPSEADPALKRAALASFFLDPAHAPRLDAQGEPRTGAKLLRAYHEAFPRGPEPSWAIEALLEAGALRPEGGGLASNPRAALRWVALGEAAAEESGGGDRRAAKAFLVEALGKRPSLGRRARLRLLMLGGGLDAAGARSLLASLESADTALRGRPECSLDADYSIHARAGAAPADLALLALAADIKKLDGTALFVLGRGSAARAFRAGLDAAALSARLEGMTGRSPPQNVSYSLEAWEREHRSLTLVSGIVLLCDDRATRFMEASPALKGRILRALAPGVLLSSFSCRAEAEEALAKAGLSTPPAILEGAEPPPPLLAGLEGAESPAAAGAATPSAAHRGSLPAHRGRSGNAALPDMEARRKEAPIPASRVMEEMEAALKASAPPRELRDALEERLRLKLLVSEAGLEPDSVRYEKHEAGGLDYLGKIRLIERACREPSWLLDILHRSPSGEPEKLLVRALSLRKAPGGLRLDCLRADHGTEGGGEGSLSLAVERISRVKRLRTSIFPAGSA